jgi:hypothetical protein
MSEPVPILDLLTGICSMRGHDYGIVEDATGPVANVCHTCGEIIDIRPSSVQAIRRPVKPR